MDSSNSSGRSMESSSRGADEDDYTAHLSVAATSPSFFPFIMGSGGGGGHLPFLHNHDRNLLHHPFPVFEPLPNYFDQVVRPGPMTDRYNNNNNNQLHQNQLFQLGARGDELGVMLPPPSLQVPGNHGNSSGQSQTSDGLMVGAPNLAIPLVISDPPKPLEERLGRVNNKGVLPPRRKPKKRTRASRRAPTTVLTTDTDNFRAMVEEFTGIPAPPFAAPSSPFLRAPLELFGKNFPSSGSATGTSFPQPPYLLRPFAQRMFRAAPSPATLFVPVSTSGDNTGMTTSTELFFPLLSDSNDHTSGNPNATSNILDVGEVLAKYSSDHDQEPADEETDKIPQVNHRQGVANDHDSSVVSSSRSRNFAIAARREGTARTETWNC